MTVEIAKLPIRELKPADLLYRVHRQEHGPWYFSGGGKGRFDPTVTGRGACYLATAQLGAWVEAFRTVMTIEEADISSRRLTRVDLDRPIFLADLTTRPALKAGVTAALTSGADYGPCQQLADQLQGKLDGILWRVRHDLEQQLLGVAWFGPEGGQESRDWPPATTEPIGADLIREAEGEFGYKVRPLPP